jgi:subtilisin family serine protease
MSYGSSSPCLAEADQILRAVESGAVPVAAAGNEGDAGNPLEFPASLAHVITVSAIGPNLEPTGFSNANGAVDLSAPGVGVLTAVPTAFDDDGTVDGFSVLAGTSFSAPMVAAAIAWVRAARPELTPYQAAQAVRLGAFDISTPGYDNGTGFGALDMPGALAQRPPAEDPLEPNDDVRYVDGRAFGSPAKTLFSGHGARIAATADYAEDPVDVYRVKVRGRHRVRLKLSPTVGDPDLFAFAPGSRSVAGRPLRASTNSGSRTDRVTVRNRGHGTRTFYVAVGFGASKRIRLFNASYVLRAR